MVLFNPDGVPILQNKNFKRSNANSVKFMISLPCSGYLSPHLQESVLPEISNTLFLLQTFLFYVFCLRGACPSRVARRHREVAKRRMRDENIGALQQDNPDDITSSTLASCSTETLTTSASPLFAIVFEMYKVSSSFVACETFSAADKKEVPEATGLTIFLSNFNSSNETS